MTFLETIDFDWVDFINFYERPFRATLIPAKIWRDLDRYCNDSEGIINYCKKWRTSVEFRKPGRWKNIAVGGEYDPDERRCHIYIYCEDFDNYFFDIKVWSRFKRRFIETIMHEMIHFSQFDRRNDNWANYNLHHKNTGNYRIDTERNYLANFDEVQAYAHDILSEIKSRYPKCSIEKFLKKSDLMKRCPSSSLKYYLKTFNYDLNSRPMLKLFDQVIKWDNKYTRVHRKLGKNNGRFDVKRSKSTK